MRKRQMKFYFPAIVWAILIFIVSSVPYLAAPPLGFTLSDKLAHFTEYFVLGALATMGFYRDRGKAPFLTALVLCSLFGLSDELHQHLVPGRTMDVYDLIADSIGSASGAAAFLVIKNRFARRSNPQLPGDHVK